MSHNMTFGYGLVYLFFDAIIFFQALVHSLVLKKILYTIIFIIITIWIV